MPPPTYPSSSCAVPPPHLKGCTVGCWHEIEGASITQELQEAREAKDAPHIYHHMFAGPFPTSLNIKSRPRTNFSGSTMASEGKTRTFHAPLFGFDICWRRMAFLKISKIRFLYSVSDLQAFKAFPSLWFPSRTFFAITLHMRVMIPPSSSPYLQSYYLLQIYLTIFPLTLPTDAW